LLIRELNTDCQNVDIQITDCQNVNIQIVDIKITNCQNVNIQIVNIQNVDTQIVNIQIVDIQIVDMKMETLPTPVRGQLTLAMGCQDGSDEADICIIFFNILAFGN
jgi:uncharacterized protein YjbI with pentapeptide repeats